jgi:hypothetical protein
VRSTAPPMKREAGGRCNARFKRRHPISRGQAGSRPNVRVEILRSSWAAARPTFASSFSRRCPSRARRGQRSARTRVRRRCLDDRTGPKKAISSEAASCTPTSRLHRAHGDLGTPAPRRQAGPAGLAGWDSQGRGPAGWDLPHIQAYRRGLLRPTLRRNPPLPIQAHQERRGLSRRMDSLAVRGPTVPDPVPRSPVPPRHPAQTVRRKAEVPHAAARPPPPHQPIRLRPRQLPSRNARSRPRVTSARPTHPPKQVRRQVHRHRQVHRASSRSTIDRHARRRRRAPPNRWSRIVPHRAARLRRHARRRL